MSLYFGLLFGLLLFALFSHLQIAAGSSWPRREIALLASLCSLLVYSIATFIEYRTEDAGAYFALIRLQVFCEPFFFIGIVEFCLAFAESRRTTALKAFYAGYAAFAALRLALPYTGAYREVDGMRPYSLPWGETINLVSGDSAPLAAVHLAFVLAAMGFSVFLLARALGRGGRRDAVPLLAAFAILLGCMILDLAIASGYLRWFYVSEGGYALVILAASFGVTDEVVRYSELKRELEKNLAEKNLLIKEIHHRVKNNLQVVASLLSLQSAGTRSGEVAEELARSMDRIRSIALVHEELYSSESLAEIDLAQYARRLVDEIRAGAGDGAGGVELRQSFDKILVGIDVGVPVGIILNELVYNSIKYGSVAGRPLALSVEGRLKDACVVLEYSDDGPGFPAGFDPAKEGGLGLTLIRTLVKQLGAQGEFLPSEVGVRYRLTVCAR
jgi:two-component sensor histidine kinase